MRVLDLFSGIGGFSLGLERAGMEPVAFCEIDSYCRRVLNRNWPDVPIYEDVRDVTAERLDADGIRRIDVVTGGFPCQDLSVAGKQAGITGERSGLWGELARIIGDIRPRYAIVENVTALISGDNGGWFGKVLGDLAEIGYDAEWHCIPASELGAHHHRDRVWIVAYPNSAQCERRRIPGGIQQEYSNIKCRGMCWGPGETVADTISIRQQGQREHVKPIIAKAIKHWQAINAESGCISGIWSVEPDVGRVANGVPRRMDRLKGLGNAVVPQIPELIGRAIMEVENDTQARID